MEQLYYVEHFKDIGYSVKFDVFDYYVDFKVYEITSCDEKGNITWSEKDQSCSPTFEENLDNAEVYLHGSVKWDGCSNWHFDEQDRCMLHGCSKEDLLNIGEIMSRCWDLTAKHCSHFD